MGTEVNSGEQMMKHPGAALGPREGAVGGGCTRAVALGKRGPLPPAPPPPGAQQEQSQPLSPSSPSSWIAISHWLSSAVTQRPGSQ